MFRIMFLPSLFLLLSLPLLACGSSSKAQRNKHDNAEQAKATASAKQTLSFDWPAPGKVLVEELESGSKILDTRIRYWLDIERDDARNLLHVSYRDVEVVGVGDLNVKDPALAERVEAVRRQLSIRPTYAVNEKGAFVDIANMMELLTELDRHATQHQNQTAEDRARFRKALQNPAIQRAFMAKLVQPWQTWVGAWVGNELPLAGETITRSPSDLVQMSWTNHGSVEGKQGIIRLTFVQTNDQRDELRKVLEAGTPPADGSGMPEILEATERMELEVEIEPATARPHRASMTTRKKTKSKVGAETKTLDTVNRYEYRFTWK